MNTPNSFHIRNARPDERAAIQELTLAAYAEHATVMAPTAWNGLHQAIQTALSTDEPGVERIVAERDGALIGSVMLFSPQINLYGDPRAEASWPELRMLAVAEMVRGQGVGRALVEECIRRAKRADAPALGLHTSDSLRIAIHLYEQMGFVRAPEHDFQPEGAELVKGYRKDLNE